MQKILSWLMAIILILMALAALTYWQFGGGPRMADVSTYPYINEESLETVVSTPDPVGNIAVASDGRVFYTIHPESRPSGTKLVLWQNGKGAAWPSEAAQQQFITPLGLRIDAQNRLWVIDHAMHGLRGARLLAFSIDTGALLHEVRFNSDVAPWGSMLQDFTIDAAGRFVYIANLSVLGRRPSVVVYDTQTKQAHAALVNHPSVQAQDYRIFVQGKPVEFLGGLVALKPGIDGIALSRDGQWLYYAAMANTTLYRLPTALLQNPATPPAQLAAAVQAVSKKPLSDGITTDNEGRIYLSDVEHGGILRTTATGQLVTLVRSEKIRWADGFSFGPGGWLYVADSAVHQQMLHSKAHIAAMAPYHIYRVQVGATAAAGQ